MWVADILRTEVVIVTGCITECADTDELALLADVDRTWLTIVAVRSRLARYDTLRIVGVDNGLTSTVSPFFTEVDRARVTVVTWVGVEVTPVTFYGWVAVVYGADVSIIALGVVFGLIGTVEGISIAAVDRAWVAVVTEYASVIGAFYLTTVTNGT